MIWTEEETATVRAVVARTEIAKDDVIALENFNVERIVKDLVSEFKRLVWEQARLEVENQDIDIFQYEDYLRRSYCLTARWGPSSNAVVVVGGPRSGGLWETKNVWASVAFTPAGVGEGTVEATTIFITPTQWDPERRVVIANWPEEA